MDCGCDVLDWIPWCVGDGLTVWKHVGDVAIEGLEVDGCKDGDDIHGPVAFSSTDIEDMLMQTRFSFAMIRKEIS